MNDQVKRLWRGDVKLARAFWEYAILYGTLVNLVATAAAFAAVVADAPGLVAVGLHLAPLPYNGFVVIAVWRSAARYRGPPQWPTLARVAVIAWAVIACVT